MERTQRMHRDLYKAIMEGKPERVEELTKQDLGILGTVTPLGDTALHVSANRGHADMVELLISLKPCIHFLLITNMKKETALHKAAAAGRLTVVEFLLGAETYLKSDCNSAGCESAHTEGSAIDLEARPHFLSFLKAQNKKKNTALHYAAKGGYVEIVDIILKKVEAIASLVNDGGESALYTACEEGRWEVAKKLLEGDSSVPYTRGDGRSCLHVAIDKRKFDFALKLLGKAKQLAGEADGADNFPLHLATFQGDLELVEELLKRNSDICYKFNKEKMAPIHIAVEMGDEKITKCLLESAPDCIHLLAKGNKNVLQLALEGRNYSVALNCLLQENVDTHFLINEPDNRNYTAFHTYVSEWSFSCKYYHVLKSMLERSRWNVNAVNDKDNTALDILKKRNWQHPTDWCIGKMIQAKGARFNRGKNKLEKDEENNSTSIQESERNSGVKKNDSTDTYAVVATLLSTVSFAAAFTIPGGFDNKTGSPVLMHEAAFKAFIISDTLSMCLSMLALFVLVLLPSSGRDRFFSETAYSSGRRLIYLALYPTLLAFATGLYVLVAPHDLWLAIIASIATCSTPFLYHGHIFFVSGLSYGESTLKSEFLNEIPSFLSWCKIKVKSHWF